MSDIDVVLAQEPGKRLGKTEVPAKEGGLFRCRCGLTPHRLLAHEAGDGPRCCSDCAAGRGCSCPYR